MDATAGRPADNVCYLSVFKVWRSAEGSGRHVMTIIGFLLNVSRVTLERGWFRQLILLIIYFALVNCT